MSMLKKLFPLIIMMSALFLAACSQADGTSATVTTPASTSTTGATPTVSVSQPTATLTVDVSQPTATPTAAVGVSQPTATPTVNSTGYAAKVGGTSPSVDLNNRGDNLTTILSIEDGDAVQFTQTTLNVPLKAKGEVYIQNKSSHDQTIVSDTTNGFAPFTITHQTRVALDFYRKGTFRAHIKGEAVSAATSLTIIITIPYTG
ncbi:hypothetical protein KDW_39790 [Dictyobacter vulcani]|uniref:EfeO-type cupredoxin-like domain-containing protein n=1 Tax=Dictyobacter vulcani TaxID=2607529 RepID=A0A5J4KTQ5_9CHLR|nr:hypothetical protein [Dictyobacter vulcani]GER89817.1 hypothetical protein KDW_39790 [Dictyobacter vulcani]